MASGISPTERHTTSQTAAHLMINTFGPAILYYGDQVMVNSEEMTTRPIGTPDFKFLIRVNQNGTFDIQRRDGITFNVTMQAKAKICQLQARAEDLLIPPWYRLAGDILQQKYSLRSAEFAENQFRILLAPNSNAFQRVDVRFLQSSWATMLIHNDKVMNVCVNGAREVAILEAACNTLGVPNVPCPHGLAVKISKRVEDDRASVRSAASSASRSRGESWSNPKQDMPITSATDGESTHQNENDGMPALIPNREIEAIRLHYIKALEVALAAAKVPSLAVDRNPSK